MNADTRMGHTSLEGASHNYANEPITLADHSEVLWFILNDVRFCTMAKFWQKKVDKYELKPQAMYGLDLNDKSED